jgi:hypothetical protein
LIQQSNGNVNRSSSLVTGADCRIPTSDFYLYPLTFSLYPLTFPLLSAQPQKPDQCQQPEYAAAGPVGFENRGLSPCDRCDKTPPTTTAAAAAARWVAHPRCADGVHQKMAGFDTDQVVERVNAFDLNRHPGQNRRVIVKDRQFGLHLPGRGIFAFGQKVLLGPASLASPGTSPLSKILSVPQIWTLAWPL